MKLVVNEDNVYCIKYTVAKLDEDIFLLYPLELVCGIEDTWGVKTEDGVFRCATTREDLKNKVLVDNIFSKSELEGLYEFEGTEDDDEEFLINYFFEDHKDTAILVSVKSDNHLSKMQFDYKSLLDEPTDVMLAMNQAVPAAVLSEKAIQELLECKSKKELEIALQKYREMIKLFKDWNKDKQVTRIYVSNGKLSYVETLNPSKKYNKQVMIAVNSEMDRVKEVGEESCDFSYKGLRDAIKERVYGHDKEINIFARKVYMNYTAKEGEKTDAILIAGPTGTGKTETIHAACDYLDIPYVEQNAANLVPQGIKGRCIEDVISDLYRKTGGNIRKTEKGIVFLDEFDKVPETSIDLKDSIKSILLTFMDGGKMQIQTDSADFEFNASRATRVFAGVFDRIKERTKSLGFNNELVSYKPLGSSHEIREKIVEKKYYTLEELSRIRTLLGYDELDRETMKKALRNAKGNILAEKRARYKRQFDIDLIATDEYIDAVLDSINLSEKGMRSLYNYVEETIDIIEEFIVEGNAIGHKQLILTKNTVLNPRDFELR